MNPMTTLKKIWHLFTKLQLNQDSKLQGDALKHVLVSSMYAEEQSAYLNSYETGLSAHSRQHLLYSIWNINNQQEALTTLNQCLTEGYRSVFSEIYVLYQNQHPCPERVLLDKVGNKNWPQFSALFQNLSGKKQALLSLKIIGSEEEIAHYGIAAWDIGRASFLARLCYENHWLSLTELQEYLKKCYLELGKTIRNWEAYTKSYLIGSIVCENKNTSDFKLFANDLLHHHKSPLLQNPW